MAEKFDEILKRRQEKAAQRKKENDELNREQENLKVVGESVPENQKPKGSAKFGQLILKIGREIYDILYPTLLNQLKELAFSKLENKGVDSNIIQLLSDGKITIDEVKNTIFQQVDQQTILNEVCPTKAQLDQIILVRNRTINKLNNLGNRLDAFNNSLNAQLETYKISLSLIETIDIASKVTSLANKFIPAPPGVPGIVTSTLSDLLSTKLSILYTTDGSLRLAPLKAIFDSAAMPLTLTSGYIKQIINLLGLLDVIILICDPYANLLDANDSLNDIGRQLNESGNDGTYKGFTFEIEEVPFNNRLIRKRAIGLNKSGIKLIETQLSFTLDNQVLIDELKLIIDRDNLKAN